MAIAMEHAGSWLPRGRLTQGMFETLVCALKMIHSARPTVAGLGTPGDGCWVHCDVRPGNVSTKDAKLFLLDLGACTWSTSERSYVGTFHCASDEILDAECKKYVENNTACPMCDQEILPSAVASPRAVLMAAVSNGDEKEGPRRQGRCAGAGAGACDIQYENIQQVQRSLHGATTGCALAAVVVAGLVRQPHHMSLSKQHFF